MVVFVEDLAPGFAAVRGLEYSARLVRGKAPRRRDVDEIGIMWIDENRRYDVGITEANIGPSRSRVGRFPDSVAGGLLARGHVNDTGIRRRDD